MPPQQNNQMNQAPMGSMGSTMPKPPQSKKPVGPIVGAVIIVLILILGGLYFWGEKLNNGTMSAEQIRNASDASVVGLQNQSSSDSVSSIEADAKATNLDGLTNEVNNISNQLGQ